MAVHKTALSSASWALLGRITTKSPEASMTRAALITQVKGLSGGDRIGAAGERALLAAFDAAKEKAGTNPNRHQIRAELTRALSTLGNERAKGRINDGYVDAREASLSKNELTKLLFDYVDTNQKFAHGKPPEGAAVAQHATFAQLDRALASILPVVDAGFALQKQDPSRYEALEDAMREAARQAGLSSKARAALMTGVNGSTSRGDGDSGPRAADVKRILTYGVDRLKGADGAQIVDFDAPQRAPTSRKDRVVTGLEASRTPSVVGKTSLALLEYADSL